MANVLFNIARGALVEKLRNFPNALGVLLLKTAEADGTLADYDTVQALLAAAGNVEADAASYARKTGITATVTVDNGTDSVSVDFPDQTWTALGAGNSIVKAVIFVQQDAGDANAIPLTAHDWSVTTDGSDVTLTVPANGFFGA